MFNTITSMIRKFCTVWVTPSERLGIISRDSSATASGSHSVPLAKITLTDGTKLPADQALLAEYFRTNEDLATPSLNAMDTRSPSYRDVIAYLVDTGATPATTTDIREAYLALYDRLPGDFELETTVDRVRQFGLVAENQHS